SASRSSRRVAPPGRCSCASATAARSNAWRWRDERMRPMRDVITAPRPGLDFRKHYGHHQSPAIRAGGLIFCSGMLPIDPETGERRHGTLTEEAHVIFGNLKLLLESAGSSLDRL